MPRFFRVLAIWARRGWCASLRLTNATTSVLRSNWSQDRGWVQHMRLQPVALDTVLRTAPLCTQQHRPLVASEVRPCNGCACCHGRCWVLVDVRTAMDSLLPFPHRHGFLPCRHSHSQPIVRTVVSTGIMQSVHDAAMFVCVCVCRTLNKRWRCIAACTCTSHAGQHNPHIVSVQVHAELSPHPPFNLINISEVQIKEEEFVFPFVAQAAATSARVPRAGIVVPLCFLLNIAHVRTKLKGPF